MSAEMVQNPSTYCSLRVVRDGLDVEREVSSVVGWHVLIVAEVDQRATGESNPERRQDWVVQPSQRADIVRRQPLLGVIRRQTVGWCFGRGAHGIGRGG